MSKYKLGISVSSLIGSLGWSCVLRAYVLGLIRPFNGEVVMAAFTFIMVKKD